MRLLKIINIICFDITFNSYVFVLYELLGNIHCILVTSNRTPSRSNFVTLLNVLKTSGDYLAHYHSRTRKDILSLYSFKE